MWIEFIWVILMSKTADGKIQLNNNTHHTHQLATETGVQNPTDEGWLAKKKNTLKQ